MEHRTLGRTGVKVSPLCLGAMMFGAWGERDHDGSIRIIHRALDAGINFIDTADVYSAGESEEIVGKRSPAVAATTSSWPPRSTARWATTPTSSATRAAGSSPRWRTACAG
jgi:aryl-alcohol dehydrogenase-like predicted oxidoreductase